MAGPIHYEIYVRKTPPSPWTLAMATEDRARAVETAEETLRNQLAVAVRVTKETLDPDTMEFASVTILTRGAPEPKRKRLVDPANGQPTCSAPHDLYTPLARERLSQVLEDWLMRQRVTAYELLHRPDLAEALDASGVELQHAIQKVAIPESQSTGQPTHDLIRHYQRLAEAAIARLVGAGRRGHFPDPAAQPLARIVQGLAGKSDRVFIMGGVICRAAAGATSPRARLERLMDLADQAPVDGPGRALVMGQIEQMLCDLLSARSGLADVLGPELDQGASLAAVVRMSAPQEISALIRADHRMGEMIPVVDGAAGRLAACLSKDQFPTLARVLARMVLRELMGPRRLRPGDALGEITILRTLAACLTATAGRLLTLDEVQAAFIERSKSLVTADFVGACTAGHETALMEVETLVRLCENVTGAANKRAAARWLDASLTAIRFEIEMRAPGVHPVQKLAILAGLQRSILACALSETDRDRLLASIGQLGGVIETDARLVTQMARAEAPPPQKITALLRLAAGQTGPSGPVADRARAEVMKLVRTPAVRTAMVETPELLHEIKGLMKTVGLAA